MYITIRRKGVQNQIHMKNRDKQVANYLSLASSCTMFYLFGLVALQGQLVG